MTERKHNVLTVTPEQANASAVGQRLGIPAGALAGTVGGALIGRRLGSRAIRVAVNAGKKPKKLAEMQDRRTTHTFTGAFLGGGIGTSLGGGAGAITGLTTARTQDAKERRRQRNLIGKAATLSELSKGDRYKWEGKHGDPVRAAEAVRQSQARADARYDEAKHSRAHDGKFSQRVATDMNRATGRPLDHPNETPGEKLARRTVTAGLGIGTVAEIAAMKSGHFESKKAKAEGLPPNLKQMPRIKQLGHRVKYGSGRAAVGIQVAGFGAGLGANYLINHRKKDGMAKSLDELSKYDPDRYKAGHYTTEDRVSQGATAGGAALVAGGARNLARTGESHIRNTKILSMLPKGGLNDAASSLSNSYHAKKGGKAGLAVLGGSALMAAGAPGVIRSKNRVRRQRTQIEQEKVGKSMDVNEVFAKARERTKSGFAGGAVGGALGLTAASHRVAGNNLFPTGGKISTALTKPKVATAAVLGAGALAGTAGARLAGGKKMNRVSYKVAKSADEVFSKARDKWYNKDSKDLNSGDWGKTAAATGGLTAASGAGAAALGAKSAKHTKLASGLYRAGGRGQFIAGSGGIRRGVNTANAFKAAGTHAKVASRSKAGAIGAAAGAGAYGAETLYSGGRALHLKHRENKNR